MTEHGSKTILRPITPEMAAAFSPWPDRIAGRQPWTPPPRQGTARAEYDRVWYTGLADRWSAFMASLTSNERHSGAAVRFLDDVRRTNNDAMAANTAVYGAVDLEAYLVSVADQLYVGDTNLVELWVRAFIVERTARFRASVPFDAVVEIGCGTGINLVNLNVHLGLAVAGCDISPNAVRFLEQMVRDVGMPASFRTGDYRDVTLAGSLAPRAGRWAVLSVHAIEQAGELGSDWLPALLALPNPPVAGIHFEPLQWGDDSAFASDCARYAELNGYNSNLLDLVRRAEREGYVRVVVAERRVIGLSAYNPTSVLVWAAVPNR